MQDDLREQTTAEPRCRSCRSVQSTQSAPSTSTTRKQRSVKNPCQQRQQCQQNGQDTNPPEQIAVQSDEGAAPGHRDRLDMNPPVIWRNRTDDAPRGGDKAGAPSIDRTAHPLPILDRSQKDMPQALIYANSPSKTSFIPRVEQELRPVHSDLPNEPREKGFKTDGYSRFNTSDVQGVSPGLRVAGCLLLAGEVRNLDYAISFAQRCEQCLVSDRTGCATMIGDKHR